MQGIDLGEQQDILTGIAAWERLGRCTAAIIDSAGGAEPGDPPGHLRPRAPANLAQVAPDQTLVGLAQAGIAETAQGLGDELVGGLAACHFEAEGLAAFEEGTELLQGLEPLGL